MYPDREMLRRWSFCHKQPSCWSRTVEPIVNVLTTEFTLTSQIFEVLSPEAESKWVLSGLQLIYANETAGASARTEREGALESGLSTAPTSEQGEATPGGDPVGPGSMALLRLLASPGHDTPSVGPGSSPPPPLLQPPPTSRS